jgi:hypothetical protein
MDKPTGRCHAPSLGRRLACDLLDLAADVPWATVTRTMNLEPVATARNLARPRPGWCAIFTKAYAHVGSECPELRRSWIPFPWPRLYEHAEVGAWIGVEREIGAESAVLYQTIPNPDCYSLADLDLHVKHCKEQPVETITAFRQQLQTAGRPDWIRALAWWWQFNVFGQRRAERFGTFGVCTVAGHGASGHGLHTPLTTNLNYGVVGADGAVDVSITFDQRVHDAAAIARALGQLERVLKNEILVELRYLEDLEAAA